MPRPAWVLHPCDGGRTHRPFCRQHLKQLVGQLHGERKRSAEMAAELQAVRACDHQACSQLAALLGANADLASRNAQLEQENASLLVRAPRA